METTRHLVATVYVVCDGATALHRHDRLDAWLPPGGHVERDELPHEAAVREVREELGLRVDLLASQGDLSTGTVRAIPRPQHFLLEDINVTPDGEVGHQHVDFAFYGEAETRRIDPAEGEQPATDWEWLTPADLDGRADEVPADVVDIGKRAVRTVDGEGPLDGEESVDGEGPAD